MVECLRCRLEPRAISPCCRGTRCREPRQSSEVVIGLRSQVFDWSVLNASILLL